jgi:haloalkane dehalogenase
VSPPELSTENPELDVLDLRAFVSSSIAHALFIRSDLWFHPHHSEVDMETLRTPDQRFANLPGYAFAPHYLEVDEIRIHYVDEGTRKASPVLMMHGEPSWSYLYRKMIPIIVGAGYRAIAPDLVGFGRSDKPAYRENYTYQRHVDWMRGFLRQLDLRGTTLVCQDWGGLIGLRLAAEDEKRFARIVAANTFLPTGDTDLGDAFRAWQKYSQEVPEFPVGTIVQGGCTTTLSPEVVAAYEAPFPDESFKAGARQFPALVPSRADDPASGPNRKAWEVFRRWQKPFLTAFSDSDPITGGADRVLQESIPGAEGQPHTTITGAGHFLQEDKGEELAQVVVDFIKSTKG